MSNNTHYLEDYVYSIGSTPADVKRNLLLLRDLGEPIIRQSERVSGGGRDHLAAPQLTLLTHPSPHPPDVQAQDATNKLIELQNTFLKTANKSVKRIDAEKKEEVIEGLKKDGDAWQKILDARAEATMLALEKEAVTEKIFNMCVNLP